MELADLESWQLHTSTSARGASMEALWYHNLDAISCMHLHTVVGLLVLRIVMMLHLVPRQQKSQTQLLGQLLLSQVSTWQAHALLYCPCANISFQQSLHGATAVST